MAARRIIRPRAETSTTASSGAPETTPAAEETISTTVTNFRRRHAAAVAWEDGGILVVGGQSERRRLRPGQKSARLERTYALWDPDARAWGEHPAPFKPRINAGLIALGAARALLVGGYGQADYGDPDGPRLSHALDDVWLFDRGDWRQLPSAASVHEAPRLVPVGSDVFVLDENPERWCRKEEDFVALPAMDGVRSWLDEPAIGPCGDSAMVHHLDGTLVWDEARREWRAVSPPHTPRAHAGLVRVGRGAMLFGGDTRDVEIFDGTRWRVVSPLPHAADELKGIVTGARVILVEGDDDKGACRILLGDVEGRAWTTSQTLPARIDFPAVWSRGAIALIGGLTRVAPVEACEVAWVTLPAG